jgi:hypothetical protein
MIRLICASALVLVLGAEMPAVAQSASFGASPLTNIKGGAAPQDEFTAKCEAINVEESVAQSCLAQVRAQEATNPSPDLNMLDARLEQKLTESFNPGGDSPNSAVSSAPMMKKETSNVLLKGDDVDDAPPPAPGALDVTKPPRNGVHMDTANTDDDQPTLQQDADIDDGPPPDIADVDAAVPDDPPDGDDPGPPNKPR